VSILDEYFYSKFCCGCSSALMGHSQAFKYKYLPGIPAWTKRPFTHLPVSARSWLGVP